MHQQIWTYMVRIPRRAMGATSEAYAGAMLLKVSENIGADSHEESPGDPAAELADKEHGQRLGEERDEDCADHHHEADEDCPTITKRLDDLAADEDADERADGAGLLDRCLPGSCELIPRGVVNVAAKVLSEGFEVRWACTTRCTTYKAWRGGCQAGRDRKTPLPATGQRRCYLRTGDLPHTWTP